METVVTIPQLHLFHTDPTYKTIISYMMAIEEFIYSQLHHHILFSCITKKLTIQLDTIQPTLVNQEIFNRKWMENQRNFDETSHTATYRRELDYMDHMILTLFYVLYQIELYDDQDVTELEKGICMVSDTVCMEHNDMGQLYMSLYKQLKKCCVTKENKVIISLEKSKEYFIT